MKLVDKEKVLDKLKELFSYAIVVDTAIPIDENEGIGMGDIVQEIDGLESLSPAELAEENLKALAVLEKLKEYLKGKVDAHLVGVRNLIRNLESDASRKGER